MNQLKKICENTPVKELVSNADVIWLSSQDTVADGLQVLVKNQIFSAPVRNSKNEPIGIVSCLDVLVYVIDLFAGEEPEDEKTMQDVLQVKGSKYMESKIAHVLDHGLETGEPIEILDENDSVMQAIEKFTKGLHRLAIKSGDKFIGLLTQSAVVSFMVSRMDLSNKSKDLFWNKTVGELKMGSKPVMTVRKNSKAIQAFNIMRVKKISGVGVVDDRGSMIGNLSSRDLNAVPQNQLYQYMFLDAGKFVQLIKNGDIQEKQPVVGGHENSNMAYVLSRMISNRIHRMYIVDQQSHPISVISLRDCLNEIVKHW